MFHADAVLACKGTTIWRETGAAAGANMFGGVTTPGRNVPTPNRIASAPFLAERRKSMYQRAINADGTAHHSPVNF
jgi:hypothetical protein